jgi:hypothetical protein
MILIVSRQPLSPAFLALVCKPMLSLFSCILPLEATPLPHSCVPL